MFPAISNEGFPDSSVGEESTCNAGDPGSIPGFGKVRWRKDRLLTLVFLGFPCGSAGKESAYKMGDLVSIPGLERSPGEGKGYLLQCSPVFWLGEFQELYSPWGHKSWTRLSGFHIFSIMHSFSLSSFCLYLYFHYFNVLFFFKRFFCDRFLHQCFQPSF